MLSSRRLVSIWRRWWISRRVLAWKLSITLETEFCLDAVNEALAHHGKPDIFNTDSKYVPASYPWAA